MDKQNNSTIGFTQALILSSLLVTPTTGELENYKPYLSPSLFPNGFQGSGGGTDILTPQYEFVQNTSSSFTDIEETPTDLTIKEKVELLLEILEDFTSFDLSAPADQDLVLVDNDVNEESFRNALKFLWDMPEHASIPVYDVHPDGQFSFVWRDSEKGILSLAFEEDGGINYASYFEKNRETHKGRVVLDGDGDRRPDSNSIIHNLIEAFS